MQLQETSDVAPTGRITGAAELLLQACCLHALSVFRKGSAGLGDGCGGAGGRLRKNRPGSHQEKLAGSWKVAALHSVDSRRACCACWC